MCDFDPPQAYRERERLARKPHPCCECSRTIRPGQRYEYASGIWDGRPNAYHTCLRCVRVREALARESGEDCWIFGGLWEALSERNAQRRVYEERAQRRAALGAGEPQEASK